MKMVITIDGGVVKSVITNQPAEVLILDKDIQGCDKQTIQRILSDDVYVYTGLTQAEVDPATIDQAYSKKNQA